MREEDCANCYSLFKGREFRKRFPNMLDRSMRRSSREIMHRERRPPLRQHGCMDGKARACMQLPWSSHSRRGLTFPFVIHGTDALIHINTGRVCAARMDEHGVHIGTCAYAGRIMRHNLVRDKIAEIATEAGFGVQREQEVECGRVVATPETHKRADLFQRKTKGQQLKGKIIS